MKKLFLIALMVLVATPAFAADFSRCNGQAACIKDESGQKVLLVHSVFGSAIEGFSGAANIFYGEPEGEAADKSKYPLFDAYAGNGWLANQAAAPADAFQADGEWLKMPVPGDVLASNVKYFEFNLGTGAGAARKFCQLQNLKGKAPFTHAVYPMPGNYQKRSAIRVNLN